MSKHSLLLLRLGVAFAFLYPAVRAWFDPFSWIGYFPDFLKGYVPDLVLLHFFGGTEILIALWILSGWRIFIPSLLASAYLIAIVAFNVNGFDVVFRDLSILAMCLALTLEARKGNTESNVNI